ncbi:unnamed protein product [Rotaria magnacalcarata]|uniref:Uncharacterized protein n=1 Tax=Rotaria magnacalcarata TaxID=392030 RepID=A0A816DVK6_9BILA|nr:unnamed protein product [Rotaria magnacalcarata]CAF1640913.1 unnamed protein product [Rotaria magnacalcarata]CAF1925089.1 unnamed protein product [Rotaria magnacalcarata]CAF4053598.1 unnamed protein product [Rotaria magnacalcarata]CAF4487453.1 unnamed protein product [Rotaria magnacalcarata]
MFFIIMWMFLLLEMGLSRPTMQRIVFNNHEWEVPNEPGWEDVIKEAEAVQHRLFNSCITAAECRRIIEELRDVFLRYPVSKKYLETYKVDGNDIMASIFKWG